MKVLAFNSIKEKVIDKAFLLSFLKSHICKLTAEDLRLFGFDRLQRSIMNQYWLYSLKVWLTGIIISPLLLMLYGIINYHINDWGIYLLMVFFSGVYSLPCLIFLGLTANYIAGRFSSNFSSKMCLSSVSLVLTLIPFYLIGNFKFRISENHIALTYLLIIQSGIWLYKLNLYQGIQENVD